MASAGPRLGARSWHPDGRELHQDWQICGRPGCRNGLCKLREACTDKPRQCSGHLQNAQNPGLWSFFCTFLQKLGVRVSKTALVKLFCCTAAEKFDKCSSLLGEAAPGLTRNMLASWVEGCLCRPRKGDLKMTLLVKSENPGL